MAKEEKIILGYYKSQVDDIRVFLREIPGRYRIRDLHQLRVRIKRLKAIFRLLEFMHPVEIRAKDHYRLFKPVFKSAGLIRESQVNYKVLRKYKDTKKLQKSYSSYIAKLRKEWDQRLDEAIESFNYDRLELINKQVEEVFSGLSDIEIIGFINDFISSEIDRIKQLIDESDDPDHIHDVRIILKNIKPLLGLIWPLDESIFDKSHYRSLNKTETVIGNWHDRLVLQESLSLFLKAVNKKEGKLVIEYSVLKNKIRKNNKKALIEISRNLDETLRKLG